MNLGSKAAFWGVVRALATLLAVTTTVTAQEAPGKGGEKDLAAMGRKLSNPVGNVARAFPQSSWKIADRGDQRNKTPNAGYGWLLYFARLDLDNARQIDRAPGIAYDHKSPIFGRG